MTDTFRLGIIGTGGMAAHHAEIFGGLLGVRLAACYDVLPEKAKAFAEKHGIKCAAPSVDDLLNDVDAVSVVTPDRFHAEMTLRALQAGKHVLCEKPLTVTLAEARQVAEAAEAASRQGVMHLINFSYRRSAAFQEAMRLARSGALGEIRHVNSSYMQSWLASHHWGDWHTSDAFLWRLATADGSGGVLGDLGCHILDLTTGAGAEIESVRCALHTFPKVVRAESGASQSVTEWRGKQLDANDTAIIEMTLAGGGIGICQTTRWATGYLNSIRVEVHGTEGAVRFDLDRDYDLLETCLGPAALDKAAWTSVTLPPAPDMYRRFLTSIQTGKQEQPSLLRGAQVQSYLDACERSAAANQWETILSYA